jgi:hypothetical protein
MKIDPEYIKQLEDRLKASQEQDAGILALEKMVGIEQPKQHTPISTPIALYEAMIEEGPANDDAKQFVDYLIGCLKADNPEGYVGVITPYLTSALREADFPKCVNTINNALLAGDMEAAHERLIALAKWFNGLEAKE